MKKHILQDKKRRKAFKQAEFVILGDKILIRANGSLRKNIIVSDKFSIKSSFVRLKNYCVLTGRSKSIYSDFKLSRIKLRELALDCLVNGVKKSSW